MKLSYIARSIALASSTLLCLPGNTVAAEPGAVPLETPRRSVAGQLVETTTVELEKEAAEKAAAKAAAARVAQVAVLRASAPAVPTDASADPQDSRVRLLLLTPGGPLLVETSVLLDGQPFRMAREKLIDDLMAEADTDKDGTPTWKEAFDNPRFASGRFMFMSRNLNEQQREQQREQLIKSFDKNPDGKIDREEARALMSQQFGGAPFNLQPTAMIGASTVDLRELLDTNKDGELSAEELAAAGTRIKSRDANDNDLVEMSELGGGLANPYTRQSQLHRQRSPASAEMAVFLGPGAKASAIYDTLRIKYAGDQPFTAERVPLVPQLIASLDTNKNGQWDADEAAGLLTLAAHLSLEAHFGKFGEPNQGLKFKSMAAELGDPAKRVEKKAEITMINLPGLKLEFSSAVPQQQNFNFEMTAKQMMTQLDSDKNGYIEKKELTEQKSGYAPQFDLWDHDSDGKVFEVDLKTFYEKQYAPQLSQVHAYAMAQGNALFGSLDVSGDNRLSLREMRLAGERLKKFDVNNDGIVSLTDVPTAIEISFGRGFNYGYRANGVVRQMAVPGAQSAAGPAWFTRMDRNGDGDVTPREFLGTPEQFQKLDLDGDGFLTREEAEKAVLQEANREAPQAEPVTQVQPAPAS